MLELIAQIPTLPVTFERSTSAAPLYRISAGRHSFSASDSHPFKPPGLSTCPTSVPFLTARRDEAETERHLGAV